MKPIILKCQTVQTMEKGGVVRLTDPDAGKQPEPGKPAAQPKTVFNITFSDPDQANQFKPGKNYSFSVTDSK